MSELQILIAGTDAVWIRAIEEIIAAQLPEAVFGALDPASLHVTPPAAAALVIDARSDTRVGMSFASRLRAMGFAGVMLLVGPEKEEEPLAASMKQVGLAVVPPDRVAHDLITRLGEQTALASGPHAGEVMRARRLVAAGAVAQRLQHSLNNPLMGLLAETQLMQLENPSQEQAAALERMVGLCRRMIELTRTLDGLTDRQQTS